MQREKQTHRRVQESTDSRVRLFAGTGQSPSAQGAGAALFTLHLFFVPVSTPDPSQAIRELQDEVSRLRLRLEDSLHQHPQGRPARSTSSCDRPTRARERSGDSSAAWSSHYGR